MNFASMGIAAVLAAGCASNAAAPPPVEPHARASGAPHGERKQVELRHFYLLSPGTSATLVVTRSDVPDSSR